MASPDGRKRKRRWQALSLVRSVFSFVVRRGTRHSGSARRRFRHRRLLLRSPGRPASAVLPDHHFQAPALCQRLRLLLANCRPARIRALFRASLPVVSASGADVFGQRTRSRGSGLFSGRRKALSGMRGLRAQRLMILSLSRRIGVPPDGTRAFAAEGSLRRCWYRRAGSPADFCIERHPSLVICRCFRIKTPVHGRASSDIPFEDRAFRDSHLLDASKHSNGPLYPGRGRYLSGQQNNRRPSVFPKDRKTLPGTSAVPSASGSRRVSPVRTIPKTPERQKRRRGCRSATRPDRPVYKVCCP